MKYRLKSAISALYPTDDGLKVLVLPAGSYVEVCGEEGSGGLVNIRFGELVVAAFAGDLATRGDRLADLAPVVLEPLGDKVRGINKAIALAMSARA